MTPDALAHLHALCFATPRPWTADEFSDLLQNPHATLHTANHGFILGRTVADEAEVLTLAVHPDHRRQGIAGDLVAQLADSCRAQGAARMFLEVAETNIAAHALYTRLGFNQAGRRNGYFQDADGLCVDAIIMHRPT